MKKILFVAAALLAVTALTSFAGMENRKKDRAIAALWEAYRKNSDADRVVRMAEILTEIKSRALAERSSRDYFEACSRYVEVESRRNWKLRDSLQKDMLQAMIAYDEPLLIYLAECSTASQEELLDVICRYEERLRKRHNSDVYGSRGYVLNDGLVSSVRNDYEYVLWDLYSRTYHGSRDIFGKVYALLRAEAGDLYPQSGIAEYFYIMCCVSEDDRDGALRDLAVRYEGKALAMLPYQTLMEREFEAMQDTGTSEDFRVFSERLKSYEHERQAYRRGIERLIAKDCDTFARLMETLESKGVVAVKVKDGKAEFTLRNIDRLEVCLMQKDAEVWKTVLENPSGSFYALDTLGLELPPVDDGAYRIRCLFGNEEQYCTYPKYTLSVASRQDADGFGVYVADWLSGEPVTEVDMELYRGDRKIAEAEDVEINGFTPLPDRIASMVTRGPACCLVCRCKGKDGRVRLSRKLDFGGRDFGKAASSSVNASVMLDRAAFNPGDTVKFKAVAYRKSSDGRMDVLPAGEKLVVRLRDARNDILAEKEMLTNGFGSVAGEFVLDGIRRNGHHSVCIYSGDSRIGMARLVVDDFVLPTFDAVFNEPEKAFLSGEKIVVSGKITAYSGHSLAEADVVAKISIGGKVIKEEHLEPSGDGEFSLEFVDSEDGTWMPYDIEVKVTELTGETQSFCCRRYVMRSADVRLSLENPADGSVCLSGAKGRSGAVLTGDEARIAFRVSYPGGDSDGMPLKYVVRKAGETVLEGETLSGDVAVVCLGSLPSGVYEISASLSMDDARGGKIESEGSISIVRVREDDSRIDADVTNVFIVADECSPEIRFGAGKGPVWAVVELFGGDGRRLESDILRLESGEIRTVRYAYKPEYPDAVRMNVLYFRDSRCYTYTRVWERRVEADALPLEFVRIDDRALPGASCSVTLKTDPDAEVLVSVFDVATGRIKENVWRQVSQRSASALYIYMRNCTGMDSVENSWRTRSAFMKLEAADEAIPFQLAGNAVESSADVPVRDDFSESLAFEPFLYPASDGTVSLDFRTSGKISTYVVSVFAHDRNMVNAVSRKDFLVTLPVKVEVSQPAWLYEGDRYVLRASVSGTSESALEGIMSLEVSDGETVKVMSEKVTADAGGASAVSFDVDVPYGCSSLDFKVVFTGKEQSPGGASVSDGVLLKVPVHPAAQTLVEAHSAVLQPGASEADVVAALRKSFVNVSSAGAEYEEVSLADMFREALPVVSGSAGRDAVSQSEAMYVNLLAAGLRSREGEDAGEYVDAAMTAVSRLLKNADADGGFGWLEGMRPSPVVTAVVLERYAGLRDRGLLDAVSERFGEDALEEFSSAVVLAVKYLDASFFDASDRPLWYGGLSLLQYLSVRSEFTGVPFDGEAARRSAGVKRYREFCRNVRSILIPSKEERWTDGSVLAKVRMLRILDALGGSEQGLEMAEAWGMGTISERKIAKSMMTELESLMEYAVTHPSGGIYYPNAVMPWRGLLESEAYAHSCICDLFSDRASDERIDCPGLSSFADGIRLWLMLQKETQQWDSDPGFVEAMASVYDGSPELFGTKVIILSERFRKPFAGIVKSGNGFRIDARYYLDDQEIATGDTLRVGDRVTARYEIHSDENRSFVLVTLPRPACMRPAEQLSGFSGGWIRGFSYGRYRVEPYAYREVKTDRTLYWMDVCPEESSVLTEELFVVQEGRFTAPAAGVESLYAPHYRANDVAGCLTVLR